MGTYSYDDQLRPSSVTRTDAIYNHEDTFWYYEPRGYVTNITEQYTGYSTGNDPKVITRSYDPYGQLASETVGLNGAVVSSSSQTWDGAGRRTGLMINGTPYNFAWRADGNLIYANDGTGGGNYAYDTAGLLTNRTVGVRSTAITARDGEGRPDTLVTAVNGATLLTETLTRSPDGLLANDTLARPDFTDARVYAYANLTRRLTQEQQNLNATTTWTNTLVYDGGVGAGPGVLTQSGQAGSGVWNGGVSPFVRVNVETNTTLSYSAYGHVNGQSTIEALLDGQPLSVIMNDTGNSTNPFQWRTVMELSPGAHQLQVAAQHPSGVFTAWATNSFTNNAGKLTAAIGRDAAGNITQRTWYNTNGTMSRMQQLWWDAKNHLTQLADFDSQQNGFLWMAEYDGLGRRVQTKDYVTINGYTAIVNSPGSVTNLSFYDPQAAFLELGVSYGETTEWKLYGPDLNGVYGGMSGTGGFDAVSPYLNLFNPVISDYRGNILAVVTNGGVAWNPARPTGYGAVPGWRPLALGHGASIGQSSVWRGRWMDLSGYYNLGLRVYDPVAGMWLSYDPEWNESDPNYLTFCGGDPVNGFDPQGKCGVNLPPNVTTTINPNQNAGQFFTNPGESVPQPSFNPNLPYTISPVNLDDQALQQNLAAWGQAVNNGIQIALLATQLAMSDGTAAFEDAALDGEASLTTEELAGSSRTALGGSGDIAVNPSEPSIAPVTDPARLLPATTSTVTPGTSYYVTADGTAIPATGYRAVGGTAVQQAENGNIMSGSGTTYITFTDLSGMSGAQAGGFLQLPFTPSQFATFDTLQIIDDLSIPGENWNMSPIPEPITTSFPKFGPGGATQAITKTPILNYTLQPFTKQ